MSKRILQIGLLAMAVISLVGCPREESSDEFEEDVQPLDGPISNDDPNLYRGRVMNGELQNALVWLDMDADGSFDSDEPGTLSDVNGRFELDVSELKRPRTEAPDRDPRNFPLMTIAVPGLTENARTGVIDRAFFLAAPPGVELITPFTTMAFVTRAETWRGIKDIEDPTEAIEERRLTLSQAGTEITRRLSSADETIGVYSDYLVSGAKRVPFYAEAFRRMIQAQIPDGRISGEASAESAGDLAGTAILPNDMDVIGSILLDQSEPLINEVDETIEMSGGVDDFQLPALDKVVDAGADLSNPWLLRQQTLYLPKDTDDFGASAIPDDVRQAGIITHDYSLGTALRRATSRGHFAPSMQPIVRMANPDGRVSELGAQPGLEFDLDNPVEGSVDAEDSADERFIFDWSQGGDIARLQSPRLGPLGLGDLADYEAEDGDRSYKVTSLNGEITAMERLEGNNGPVDYAIEASGDATKIGRSIYSLFNDQNIQRTLVGFTRCQGFEAQNDRVINAKQEIAVTDGNNDPLGTELLYGHKREDGDEGPEFRVLLREFVAESGVNDDNWRWEFEYYDDGGSGELLSSQQPDLIRSKRLVKGLAAFDNGFCKNNTDERPLTDGAIDAFIGFEHIPFTQYLEQVGTGN